MLSFKFFEVKRAGNLLATSGFSYYFSGAFVQVVHSEDYCIENSILAFISTLIIQVNHYLTGT